MSKKVIGIDLGGTNLVGALMIDGKIVKKEKIPTEADKGKDRVLDNIAILIEKLKKDDPEVKFIGIGTPGNVMEDGEIYGSPNIKGWHGTKLYDELKSRVSGIEVVAGNDVDVAALGEVVFGTNEELKKSKVAIFVALGTGIGGGIIIDGKVFTGAYNMAGEIGHMTIEVDGRECSCGKKGCWETYGSATGIKRTFVELYEKKGGKVESSLLKEKNINDITTKDIYDWAKKGDKFSLEVTKIVNKHMAVGVGNLINIFNPDFIVIGGGVSLAGEFFFTPLREEVKNHAFERMVELVKIIPSSLKDEAGLYGACALAIERFYK